MSTIVDSWGHGEITGPSGPGEWWNTPSVGRSFYGADRELSSGIFKSKLTLAVEMVCSIHGVNVTVSPATGGDYTTVSYGNRLVKVSNTQLEAMGVSDIYGMLEKGLGLSPGFAATVAKETAPEYSDDRTPAQQWADGWADKQKDGTTPLRPRDSQH